MISISNLVLSVGSLKNNLFSTIINKPTWVNNKCTTPKWNTMSRILTFLLCFVFRDRSFGFVIWCVLGVLIFYMTREIIIHCNDTKLWRLFKNDLQLISMLHLIKSDILYQNIAGTHVQKTTYFTRTRYL